MVDYGFAKLISLADAFAPGKGFLVDESITIKIEIKIQLEKKCTSSTRQSTGFVGLENQVTALSKW